MLQYVVIWVCLGILGAMISNGKGNNGCGGFVLGALLGPIGLLIAFFSSSNPDELRKREGTTKKCPHCAEYVRKDATVCRYCGRKLSDFDIEQFRR